MNENPHNFKIEHKTAFKLEKHIVKKVDKLLINCLNKNMENKKFKNFWSIVLHLCLTLVAYVCYEMPHGTLPLKVGLSLGTTKTGRHIYRSIWAS